MTATTTEPQPHQVVWTLAQAVVPSRALHVVAELGVADALGDGACHPKELAAACHADTAALDRVLRLLCAHGIFEVDGDRYRHNAASRLLRSDDAHSMRAFARLNGLPAAWRSIGALDHAVRTGRPGIETVDAEGFFTYLAAHPDEAGVFELAMAQKARADIVDLLDAFDFQPFRTIADIGGGTGHLLDAALAASPHATGVLFDLPDVIARCTVTCERLRTRAGDFFADPLPAADLYLLMEVLHDWRDQEASSILAAVRRAAEPGATILVIEHIPSEEGMDVVSQTLDVLMLAVTGGFERAPSQMRALLRAAGFEPSRVVRTAGAISAIEAVAV